MKRKKNFPVFLITFIICLAFPRLASPQEMKARVILTGTQMHLAPDAQSQVIRSVPVGAVLNISGQQGDWFKVDLPADDRGFVVSGYIHSSALEMISGPPPAQRPTPVPVEPYRTPQRQAPPPTYRQPPARGGMPLAFKVMAGMALSTLATSEIEGEGEDLDDWKQNLWGPVLGIGIEVQKSLGFEIDALYIRKGMKLADSGTIEGTDYDLSVSVIVNQLSIPVLVKLNLMQGGPPYILAGGEVGLVLSAKAVYDIQATGYSDSGSEDIKEDFKSMDFGLVAGVGHELNFLGYNIFLEARYHLGMQDLNADSEFAEADDWVKSRSFVFVAGVKF